MTRHQLIYSFYFQTINAGRFITTYSAILLILIAFIEAQINFCFLSRSQTRYKKEKYSRKSRRPQQFIDNDQTADLEYVIPKVKPQSNELPYQSFSFFYLFFFCTRRKPKPMGVESPRWIQLYRFMQNHGFSKVLE